MEGTIKCKRCRWCFTEEEEYQKHLEDHILCKRCHLGFNKRDYRNHMKDHAYNESKCPHCHKQFKPSNPEHVGTMYDDHLHSCKRAPLLFTQKKTDSTSSQVSTSVQKMPKPNFCDEGTNKNSKYEKGNEFLESNTKPCIVILTDVSCTSGKNCKVDVTMADNISNGSTVVKKNHSVSTTHRCNCGGEFSSKDDYELHVEREHTSLHCSKCGFTFKSVVAHALHSCNETSFTANVTTGNYDRLSSKNANVEKVSSDAFGQCEISKLPAASTSLSANHDCLFFNEDCDIKPAVPSGNFHSPLVKKLVEENVSLSSIKAESTVPSSHNNNKPSWSESTTPQNAEFPLNVSSSSITNNVQTTTCVVQKNNCKTLKGFCERNATLYTKKQRNSVDTNPKNHVQTSISAHHLPWHGHFGKATHYPQMQHHHQNMYGLYPQWDSMGVKNLAQCTCYQCNVSKVNFNNSLMTDNLSKPGNEMLSYFTNASLHQMHKSEYAYYPTHSRLPCLIPALNKEASLKYHGACMPQNLVSGKQIESSLKFHKFPEILNTNSIVNTKSNICHINDIRTVKDFADRPKKIVNVVFPEARSDCHASAVMSVDEKQSISHYNCEMCSNLFYTAESVIMHLQDEHHVKIGNELRVFAL